MIQDLTLKSLPFCLANTFYHLARFYKCISMTNSLRKGHRIKWKSLALRRAYTQPKWLSISTYERTLIFIVYHLLCIIVKVKMSYCKLWHLPHHFTQASEAITLMQWML